MNFKKLQSVLLMTMFVLSVSFGQSLSGDLEALADIVVDINGNGDYTSVQQGINAIPDNNQDWLVLYVKKGVYREKVILGHMKTKVILVGEDVDSTIITWDDYGDKMLVDGDPAVGGHTFSTYTFRADPHDFQAYNITFENPTRSGQGVAFHSNGDRQILYHVRMLGYQDTYFDNYRTRRYMKDCFIEGVTDYIFGFGVTLFDSCQIHNPQAGYITASSTPQYYEFGHVLMDCRITGAPGVSGISLGRPWFPYSNTIFYECWLPAAVKAGGWDSWSGREATCIYREYNNFGPGSDYSNRVDWGKQLDPSLATRYNIDTILAASNFPSHMGPEVDSIELFSMRQRFTESGYTARADTILYAGRDTFPEYPTEDWSPEFYAPVYDVITEYTVPFMDSVNGELDVNMVYWDDNELEGFDLETLNYVIEFGSEDAYVPAFTVDGTGFLSVTEPSELPGVASLFITSRDKVNGAYYKVYLSQDSAYWSTVPKFVVINTRGDEYYRDTLYLEKGNFNYTFEMATSETDYRYAKVGELPEQDSEMEDPEEIPGDLVISVTSASGDRMDDYTITITRPVGVEMLSAKGIKMFITSPVTDRLLIHSTESFEGPTNLKIYDLNGRLIHSEIISRITEGVNELNLDASLYEKGVYVYSLDSEMIRVEGKILKY